MGNYSFNLHGFSRFLRIPSIMLNWIALFLSNFIVAKFLVEKGQQKSMPIHDSAMVKSSSN